MTQETLDPKTTPNGMSMGGELIAGGHAVQQVRTGYCTAVSVQRPRILPEVKRKLLEEARLMGEDAYYGWGVGKNAIEGPSIDLALAAARCWGNCATDLGPVQDLVDCWIFTAYFIDLETGYTRTRQFRQSKNWTVHGKLDDERKDDVRFQIGQSKAERNVILKALPAHLINAALEAAKEGVRHQLEELTKKHGFAAVADRLITALGKCGVKEVQILAKSGVAERKALTTDHLVILRGDLNALQNGQERAEVLFPAVEEAKQPEQPKQDEMMPAPSESAPEESAKKPSVRKITKKTLMLLNDLAAQVKMTPMQREEMCAQANVNSFEELTEENAQTFIRDLRIAATAKPAQREPGSDDEPSEGQE